MRPIKVLLLVLGSLALLAAFGMFLGGVVLAAVYGTQRDDDGFLSTPTERLTTDSYAITTEDFELLLEPGSWDWIAERLGDVRVTATGTSGDSFVGVGPASDVSAYLAGVAHDEVDKLKGNPFEVTYERRNGEATPADPGAQSFWVATATGAGEQELSWSLEEGRWTIVLMNADGSRGVDADVSVGAKSDLVPIVAAVLVALGVLGGLIGLGLVVAGATGNGGLVPQVQVAGAAAATMNSAPVRLEGDLDPGLSRWLWLIKWLLAVPHFVVLAFLWIAFVVLTLIAGVAILFTGRYPRSLFDFNVGVLRWSWRVGYYATSVVGTDRYPPFSLGEEPDYPATLTVAYPERLSRGLVLVKWWLLALPHYVILAALTSGPGNGGLVTILVIVAGAVLLFSGQYPAGLHSLLVGISRWSFRVAAYAGLMTDVYPPFRLDQGAREPEPEPALAKVA